MAGYLLSVKATPDLKLFKEARKNKRHLTELFEWAMACCNRD